jgi:muramidase (phage lysozyme)
MKISIIIPVSKDEKRARLEFQAGKEILELSLELSQDNRASSCSFTIHDPDGKIGGMLLREALAVGGIAVPKDLLEDPNQNQSGNIPTDSSNGTSGGDTNASRVQAIELTPNQKAALDTIAYCEGTIGARGYQTIASYLYFTGNQHPGIIDPELYRKTGLNSDASGRYQFISTTWQTLGMPDFSPKNQDRGAIRHLDRMGATAAINSGDVDQFLRIASGSAGWASLPYSLAGQPTKTVDEAIGVYNNAFKFYNGLNSGATQTALLKLAGIPASALPTETKQEEERKALAKLAGTPLNDRLAAASKAPNLPMPTTLVGTPIIISCEYEGVEVSYEFLLTGIEVGFIPSSTQIRGASIKAQIKILNGEKRSGSYKNISLAKFAEIVSVRSRLQPPEILGSDASLLKTIEIISDLPSRGKTDLQLLNEFASRQGFSVRDGDGRLILEPVMSVIIPSTKMPEVAMVIDETMLLPGTRFSEQASADRITGQALPDIGVEIPTEGGNIVKGFASQLTIVSSGEVMKLKPGSVIRLEHRGLPTEVNRLWRVDRVSLNLFSVEWTIDVFLPAFGDPEKKKSDRQNGLQSVGAIPVYAGNGQKYPLAGVGLVGSEDEVSPGSGITWADFTRKGERITNDSLVVNRAIALARKVAEVARPALGGKALKITSWWRTPAANTAAGGSSQSRHLVGDGIDFYVEGMTPAQVYAALDPVWTFGGLSKYELDGHIHIDNRGTPSRW